MNVYEAIYARRSVRDFMEKDIPIDTIAKIIDAGLQAPINNHMREWEFVVIRDKKAKLDIIDKVRKNNTKKDAVNLLDYWGCTDEVQRNMYIEAIPKQYQMLLNAGCIIIPCYLQKTPLLKPENLSALNSFASIWCCIENMLLAAVSEGIYGVTRIPFEKELEHIREIVRIPKDYEIACYLALGYPSEDIKPAVQHIYHAEDKMHFNVWKE